MKLNALHKNCNTHTTTTLVGVKYIAVGKHYTQLGFPEKSQQTRDFDTTAV